jgi:hypothetical protein
MNTPPRHLPRFLPTLTEVFQPSEAALEPPPLETDCESLTRALMIRVDTLVQARVQQELEKLIRSAVVEHAQAMVAGLQAELHHEVREMVLDAVSIKNESNKFNS